LESLGGSSMLETTFQDYTFQSPLMNASGVHCMTTEELNELANSKAGTFVTKSVTKQKRQGNPEPRYYETDFGSINSMGLPNLGFDYYLDYLKKHQKIASTPVFFSVASMSMQDNIETLKRLEDNEFRGFTELNLSCPNVPGKPQVAYDFETTEKILTEVFSFFTKPLGVKLPPYFDLVHFDQMATILNKFPLAFVNSINSVGNGLIVDAEKEQVVIKPKEGFGGIGGQYIKPTALANVRAFYLRLNPSIQIIGTGGITSGQDAFEHLLCGASMLQIGTQLYKEGTSVFSRVLSELEAIMDAKGYSRIEQFRGNLKTFEE